MKRITFLQALYGSQHTDLTRQGKDGQKARMGANLLLSAFIIVLILDVFLILNLIPATHKAMTDGLTDIFGYGMGKSIGRLVAIPLLAGIYFIIAATVGSQRAFDRTIAAFLGLPEEERKRAAEKLLPPMLAAFAILVVLLISGLFI